MEPEEEEDVMFGSDVGSWIVSMRDFRPRISLERVLREEDSIS